MRRQVCCGCNYNLDLLAGYRYLNLSEGLHITEDLVALRAVPAAGTGVGDHIIVIDNFNDVKVGDVFECYRTEEFARTLESTAS